MATTGSNFVEVTVTTLNGSTVTTAPYVEALGPKEALDSSQPTQPVGGSGSPVASKTVCVDRVVFDPSFTTIPAVGYPPPIPVSYGTQIGAFAKNGCILLTLSGSTAQNIDLTNLASSTAAPWAGDTGFSNVNLLILNNLGTHDLVLSPGSSNPAGLPVLGGTTPTLTLPAGSITVAHSVANIAVSGSAKILTVTPAAGGSLAVTVCGS